MFELSVSRSLNPLAALFGLLHGLVFSALLQLPYSESFNQAGPVGYSSLVYLSTGYLLFRLGQFAATLFDRRFPKLRGKVGVKISGVLLTVSVLLVLVIEWFDPRVLFVSALVGGLGAGCQALVLRNVLTSKSTIKDKRVFNIVSIIAFSIGVGAFGFIKLSPVLLPVSVLVLLLFIFIFLGTDSVAEEKTYSVRELKNELVPLSRAIFVFSLLIGVITGTINIVVMQRLAVDFSVSEIIRSSVLILPIVGASFTLLSGITFLLNRFSNPLVLCAMALVSSLGLLLFYQTSSFYIFCGVLVLLGFTTTECKSYLFQIVATRVEKNGHRSVHRQIEVGLISGTFVVWLVSQKVEKIYFTEFQFLPSLILAVVFGTLLVIYRSLLSDKTSAH